MLGLFPAVTLIVFLGPILAGLLGTILPSFGLLPALGGTSLTLQPWRDLLAAPGFGEALRLTLTTGFASTLLSFALVVAFCAAFHGSRPFAWLRHSLGPLLAVPHAAFAIGLAFLLAPSGWLARLVSPWATGWDRPPDLALIQDPGGIAMVVGLVVKEVPFLLLMTIAALGQTPAENVLRSARSMGYGPVASWLRFVLPLIYSQIRLPLFAVLAYSLSAVEIALLLGPTTPPPLTPLLLRWFADPDLGLRFQAAAGAVLQLGVVLAAIGAWLMAEQLMRRLAYAWLTTGRRGGSGAWLWVVSAAGVLLVVAVGVGAMVVLAVWGFADRWRFPDALPVAWTLDTLHRTAATIRGPLATTATTAAVATLIALVLVVGCLEHEVQRGVELTRRTMFVLYLPLLIPAVAFLFGIQVLLILWGLDGSWPALILSHELFVLPYVFLALRAPYLALDPRYERAMLALGRSRLATLAIVKLPLLLRPLLTAAAVGFAVSVGQYLPTLFAGAGRLTTVTTEAVALAAGADRRVAAVYAFAQAVLPLLAFGAATLLPNTVFRHRRGMRVN